MDLIAAAPRFACFQLHPKETCTVETVNGVQNCHGMRRLRKSTIFICIVQGQVCLGISFSILIKMSILQKSITSLFLFGSITYYQYRKPGK